MSTPILDHEPTPPKTPLQQLRAATAREKSNLLWFSRPKHPTLSPIVVVLILVLVILGPTILPVALMIYGLPLLIIVLFVLVLLFLLPWRRYRKTQWAIRHYDRLYYGLTADAFWVVSYQSLVRIPLETLTHAQLYQQGQFQFQCTDEALMNQSIMHLHRLGSSEPATYTVSLLPGPAHQLRQALLKLNHPISMADSRSSG